MRGLSCKDPMLLVSDFKFFFFEFVFRLIFKICGYTIQLGMIQSLSRVARRFVKLIDSIKDQNFFVYPGFLLGLQLKFQHEALT